MSGLSPLSHGQFGDVPLGALALDLGNDGRTPAVALNEGRERRDQLPALDVAVRVNPSPHCVDVVEVVALDVVGDIRPHKLRSFERVRHVLPFPIQPDEPYGTPDRVCTQADNVNLPSRNTAGTRRSCGKVINAALSRWNPELAAQRIGTDPSSRRASSVLSARTAHPPTKPRAVRASLFGGAHG